MDAMGQKRISLAYILPASIADAFHDGHTLKNFRESFLSLFLCTTGDLITGIVMGIFTSSLKLLPALIVLIPAAIGMRGNIFASLGSRLGTYLHTGQIEPDFKSNDLLNQNMLSSIFLTLIMSLFLGIVATIVSDIIGLEVSLIDMVLISMLAGVLSAIFMMILTVVIAFSSYKHGWDPDNMTAPIITLFGDMLTLPLLFVSMYMVLGIGYNLKIISLLVLIVVSFVPMKDLHKKRYYGRIVKEGILVLFLCGVIGMFSGTFLGVKVNGLIGIPALLMMIPPFLEDGGAIGSILAARLSSLLHLGSIGYDEGLFSKRIVGMFLMMHVLGLIIFTLIGIFAYVVSIVLGMKTLPLLNIIFVSLLAGEMLIFIVNILAYYTSVLSFKRGVDPDNVAIPIITSVIDLVGVVCLLSTLFTFGMI